MSRTLVGALAFSIFIHAGFYAWAWWSSADSSADKTVSVQVQYQPAQARAAGKMARPRAVSPQLTSPGATSLTAGDHHAVMGAELGIHATYPRLSRVLGESGEVRVELHKDDSGGGHVQILRGSGFSRLDEAALRATQEAMRDGRLRSALAGRERLELTFVFKLR